MLLLAGCSGGDAYPNRPILLVCPWAPNGGSDRVARQVAMLLEQDLKVNVNVKNSTGGEGVTGHGEGAASTPDGYTLTLMTVEINMLRWRGRTKLSYKDFEPAVLLNRDPAGIFVRKDAPWTSLKELEADVRRAPGSLRASGTALGGIWHLALAGWLSEVGLKPADVIWVASQGSTPALRDLMAKGVEIVACSLPEAKTLMIAGELRCLGVMSEARQPLFPDVPTAAEQGVAWTMGAWRGIGLPRGTSKRVVDVLVPALERVAKSERFLAYMSSEGFGAACEGPAAFDASLAATDERMKALLTSDAFRTLSVSRFGAMTFPAALAVILALAAVLNGRPRRDPDAAAVTSWRRFGEGVLLVVAYLALSNTLGFVLTAIPIVFVALWRLGTRPASSAAIAISAVLAAYAVFGLALRVPFPRGPW
ncbi:MAG TPA: tripartite tricarboxylate transporter substrate binding protein [Planctomycetota bacterium]